MNWLFLGLEFAMVSVALLGAYGLRSRLGLGPVIAVVASLQFLQALLGGSLYWSVGPGLILSPGSCILFAGTLAMVVFAFASDGVLAARSILYGVIVANVLNVAMSLVLAAHIGAVEPRWYVEVPPEIFDRGLVVSLIGVALLYLDQILAILAFAWARRRFPELPVWLPMAAVLAGVLAFDTLGYISLLFFDDPELRTLLVSGLITKGAGGLAFGVVWGVVLGRQLRHHDHSLNEVLGTLLFRESLATLRQAAVTDEMTGLFNRRSYRAVGERVMAQSVDEGQPFGLLLVDADHFKQVNDRLGHSTGDEVIVAIADAVRGATRHADFCFRLGGDEFALLLPRCDHAGALEVATRVGAFEWIGEGLEQPVSLTIGLAVFPDDADALDLLFEVADKRLYEGKEGGRGRIVGRAADAQPAR